MTPRIRALPPALALAVLSLLIGAVPAGAATYQSVQCSALGVPAPDAHEYAIGAFATFADYCNEAGRYLGLGVQGTAATDPSDAIAGWSFSAPPATSFVGASAVAKGRAAGGVIPELLASEPGRFEWGSPRSDTEQPLTWQGETGPHDGILVQLRCDTSPYPCPSSSDAYLLARQFVFTLTESSVPKIDKLGSALVESAPTHSLRGKIVVGVSASDAGSGLDAAYVEAADKRLATAHYACTAIPASPGRPRLGRRLAPCPGQGGKFLSVDTADPVFHTGLNHGVRVCVSDFAGQAACENGPDVRIDNACPDAGVGVASLANVRLKGGVGSSGKPNVKKTRFGRKVKIRGRALNGADGPVEGATICLGHHVAGDAYGGEEVNWTKTGPQGRFRFKLQRGPSQDFRIAAWQGASALEEYRTLLVKAKPKLKIKGKARPRKRIRLRATLNPPRVGGKRMKLEGKGNAGWVSVPRCGNVTTDAKGKVGCRFKVPPGTAGSKLQFRAVVPREAGYPYLRGHSRVKSERVR